MTQNQKCEANDKMTLKDLLYISTIAKEKSISRAASKLYVSQPSLSQIVKKVETELDSVIFQRTNNGVAETEEGRCFLDFANNVLWEQKMFEKKLCDIKNNADGRIRIGLTGTQAAYVLPHFLPRFKKSYPDTEVILVEKSTREIKDLLLKDELDIGIIHPPISMDGLDAFELSHDDIVIVPRKASRYQPYIYYMDDDDRPYIHLDFLKNEPIALSAENQQSRIVCDQVFLRAGISPMIKQTSKNLIALDALAQVDYATVLLPRKQLSAELQRRSYFYIAPEYAAYYPFYVVTCKNIYQSLATQRLLELLQSLKGTF